MKQLLPTKKNKAEIRKFSTGRLEAMTDGVFAIAMTLLVLDLDVSRLGRIATNQELQHALIHDLGPNFISFVTSFILLGSMWAIHVRQFQHIKYVDRHMMTINNFRLLAVVLIPFTASLSGAYGHLFLAQVLFPLNFLILAIMTKWQWDYAVSKPEFYDPQEITPHIIDAAKQRNFAFIIIAAIVTILATYVGSWAFMLFVAMPIVIAILPKNDLQKVLK